MSSTSTSPASGGKLAGIIVVVVLLFAVVIIGPIWMFRDGGWWKKGGGHKAVNRINAEGGNVAMELRDVNGTPDQDPSANEQRHRFQSGCTLAMMIRLTSDRSWKLRLCIGNWVDHRSTKRIGALRLPMKVYCKSRRICKIMVE